jgi:PAS domain S-box-containing protein
MKPPHKSDLLRQLGGLFRLSAQILAGLDDERDVLVEPARRPTPAQRQHQYFEAVLRNSPAAIVMLDPSGQIVACNPAFEKLFGYAQAEIVGRDLDDLVTTEATRAESLAYTHQAMTDIVHTTARRRRKDGSFVDVELVGIPVSVGEERVGAVALYEDITELKQMEAWLRLANAALEAAANAIIICDREGYIIWVNPAFTRLTGYAPEEAIGQTMRLLKSGQHDEAFYQRLWGTILAGQEWQGETTNRRKDGSLYAEAQTIAPVRDPHGVITHFISIKQPVTTHIRAEEELQTSKEHGGNS